MDKYTVLLVDDEEEVIQVIIKKIAWEQLGFEVIGYANNGVKALELVEEYQPDVVMTDVKMPYMDGMELSTHIKDSYPATKILIFTGFDEFEYAKQAVHLEVEEYLLKPVNSQELTKVFEKLHEKLTQEINEKRNVEMLRQSYIESLPLFRANFYSALIEGRVSEEEIAGYLTDYGITFEKPLSCCIVIHTSSAQINENMNLMLTEMAVQKQVRERLKEKWQAKDFFYMGNTVIFIQLDHANEISELTDECDRFCRYIRRMIDAVVTIGIGTVCDNIVLLSQSYNRAKEALSYRAIYGTSRAINISEIEPREKIERNGVTENVQLTNLLKMIRVGESEDVESGVREYLEDISSKYKSLQQHHIDIMELVSALYRFVVNNDMEVETLLGDMEQLYGKLLNYAPENLCDWLTETSLKIRDNFANARNRSTKSFVRRAEDFVHNNYSEEELSLDEICEVLGVSNSYFSTIFKKETGESFIGYLTRYRMEQAARMLLETDDKNYIVAKNVGYADPNYFSYVFKRQFGMSPSKFRAEQTNK